MQWLFKLGAVLALWTSVAAMASGGSAANEPISPYRTVTPFNAADATAVVEFFKFDCPFCRNYHQLLSHWGSTLPAPLHFEYAPVLEGDASGGVLKKNAIGYLAFQDALVSSQRNMDKVSVFMTAAYDIEQDSPGLIANPSAWMDAARSAGISSQSFMANWRGGEPGINAAIARQTHYALKSTPTLIICGKYAITPDNTRGDEGLFMQLANATVSKCLIENGAHP